MSESKQYRREEDREVKLLILLNERVSTMQKSVEKLTDKQSENPCKTHELRLQYLERIMWIVISAIILLTLKAAFSFFLP